MKKFPCVLFVTFVIFLWSIFSKTGITSGETVCEVNMSNIPDNTVFVELFVEESVLSDNYTKCNETVVKQNNILPEAEIVTTKFDNFISYTYHHKNSSSLSNLNNCKTIYNGDIDNEVVYAVFWDGIEKKSIEKYNALMIAYVDEFGQILGKSDVIHINKFMEKSILTVDGEDVTVRYNNVKTSTKLLVFLSLVLIESVLFVALRNDKREPIRGRFRPIRGRFHD